MFEPSLHGAAPQNGTTPATTAARPGRKPGPRSTEPMTVSAAVGRIHGVLKLLTDPADRIAALGVALADAKKAALQRQAQPAQVAS